MFECKKAAINTIFLFIEALVHIKNESFPVIVFMIYLVSFNYMHGNPVCRPVWQLYYANYYKIKRIIYAWSRKMWFERVTGGMEHEIKRHTWNLFGG